MSELRNAVSSTLERLKGLRLELGISVEDLSSAADVSVDEYLQIEAGEKDLSFTFLFKCANRFGVDIASIVTGDEPRLSSYTLSRSGEGMPIKRREGFEYNHIAYLLKDRLAEPFVVIAKYSKTLENAPVALSSHGGQELNYCLEGRLKVVVDGHTEYLNPGDSLFYDGHKKHGMVAVDGADCKFLSVVIKGSDGTLEPTMEKAKKQRVESEDNRIYKEYVNEVLDEDGYLKEISFNVPSDFNFGYDCVDVLAEKSPDKLAMLWVSANGDERRFTFSDMKRYSNKTANYFKRLGIKKGDKVMLVLRRHYQFWFAMTALHKLGAVVIPATDQLTTKDFIYRFEAAEVSAIICTAFGQVSDMVDEAVLQCEGVKIKVIVNGEKDGYHCFDRDIENESDELERVETSVQDTMLMYFTSGTTGYPKIAQQSYSYALGHIITAKWWHNVDPNGIHFTVSDTGWGKAVWGKYYGQWLCEAAIFTCDFERFNPVDLLPMFKKYNITTFCAPPTIFRFFIKEDLSKYDLSSIQYACIAGEALNPEVYQQFFNATGIKLMEGFGQTETTLTIANLLGMEPKPGSMGKPSPAYDVVLIDGNGKPVGVGDVGEICISTKNGSPMGMFTGYYRNKEKTDEVWYDGCYHTGDMAWQDEDGYLWYVGRTDDLIKSSGYRIGPFEIESVLMEMPCVTECAVTGVPDTEGERGQLVKATIVLAKDYKPSEELKKEIQTYVKEHTAPYKYPRIVEFVESLPKTISGKIRRVEIRGN